MANETWARADELLGLNIEDLILANREALVNGKGGDRKHVCGAAAGRCRWPTSSAEKSQSRPE